MGKWDEEGRSEQGPKGCPQNVERPKGLGLVDFRGHAESESLRKILEDQRRRVLAEQRQRYQRRLEQIATTLSRWSGIEIPLPAGGFYLWFDAGDGWAFAERLATQGGALVSPGDFYGSGGSQNIRVAVVQPDDRLTLVAERLGVA
jgi:aspartate/methionine/tyrosine aminotransferase